MKKLFYGRTGRGKSRVYVAPIIIESPNVLLITSNISVADEEKYMGLGSVLKQVDDLDGIQAGKFGILAEPVGENKFNELLDRLEANGISENPDFTIVFINTTVHFPFYCEENFINRLNGWKCNIVIEHTCHSKEEGEMELKLKDDCWSGWECVPVFEKLS